MKKILLLILLLFSSNIFSQLANSNMTLLANRNQHIGGASYSACWGYRAPNGREYAILGCGTGTAFVEITDTLNIIERAFKTGLTSGWREMKVFSNYCYVVSEANGSGLQIFDLQYLPDSVRLVTTYTYAGYTRTHSISQSGPYLYLHGGNVSPGLPNVGGVTVLDLTNPVAPVKRGSWGTQYVHDSRILQDTIWACNIYDPPLGGVASIFVINATNKDNLTTINSWINNPNPFPHNCAIPLSNRRYILTTDEKSSPNGKLKIWDRSNLSAPVLAYTWMPTGIITAIVHNVEIYGNYAIVAHYRAGVRVVNISNPTAPVEAAWYDTYPSSNSADYSGCWGVFMFPSGKIIGSDMQTGLYVLKTTFNIVGVNSNENVPVTYKLSQNYPNPFNPTTKIKYEIPKDHHVKILVYDATGRQVAILADEFKRAGSYSVSYDAGRLASGVYYYSLITDDYRQSKKMTLLK